MVADYEARLEEYAELESSLRWQITKLDGVGFDWGTATTSEESHGAAVQQQLSSAQVAKLDGTRFNWGPTMAAEQRWDENFEEVLRFREKHGRLPKRSEISACLARRAPTRTTRAAPLASRLFQQIAQLSCVLLLVLLMKSKLLRLKMSLLGSVLGFAMLVGFLLTSGLLTVIAGSAVAYAATRSNSN